MAEVTMGVSLFKRAWDRLEQQSGPPQRARNMMFRSFKSFSTLVWKDDENFIDHVTRSLYAGDLWILRGAFSPQFMGYVKRETARFMRSEPSSFHKMLEGSPDFHRKIDLEAGKRYSFHCCKHAAYFYRWNRDPLGLWPHITERWRVIKKVMGLPVDAYERNTPKDGVVDRIQVVRYPPAIGFLEPHADPHLHQRLFLSGYMSRRGVDFDGGGFYAVGDKDAVLDVEREIHVGDICIGYATVYHGVAPCDRHKKPRWDADDGRWFLSMYSNASDEVPSRHTGHAVKLDIPGVLP